MLEELAKAMNDSYQTHGQVGALRTSPLPDDCALSLVRRVLERLCGPTEDMLSAGIAARARTRLKSPSMATVEIFRAMIDTVLEEGGE